MGRIFINRSYLHYFINKQKESGTNPIEVSDADREYLNSGLASKKITFRKKSYGEENRWRLLFFMWCNCYTECPI